MTLDINHQKLFLSDNLGYVIAANMNGSGTPEILFEYGVDNIVALGMTYVAGDDALYMLSSLP